VNNGRRGIVLGLAAYVAWGVTPLFWPLLEPSGAAEILAHRIVWSVLFVGLLLFAAGRGLRTLPRDRRRIGLLTAASLLIAVNWGTFIWAVNHGHVVEASLGYFINPLVSVALAVLVLGERLRALQWVAVGIATAGVAVLTVDAGRPPWIAIVLAASFGVYGLVKKVVNVGATEGLFVETAVLTPAAIVFLVVLEAQGNGTVTTAGAGHGLLLLAAGPVTALPLIAFAAAASTVPLAQLGLLFYINPGLQLLIGVVVRHEPFGVGRAVGFGLVWLALVVFTAETLTRRQRDLELAVEATAA
jgi:chloramphenicol-sensitive protein RarD